MGSRPRARLSFAERPGFPISYESARFASRNFNLQQNSKVSLPYSHLNFRMNPNVFIIMLIESLIHSVFISNKIFK